jgi:hypothetical protein
MRGIRITSTPVSTLACAEKLDLLRMFRERALHDAWLTSVSVRLGSTQS